MRWKNRNLELQLQAKEQKSLFLTVFNCFRKPTSQHRNSCYLPTVCRALKTTHKVNEMLAQGAVRSRLPTPTAVLEQEPSHALPSGQRDTRGDTHTTCLGVCARPGPAPLPCPRQPGRDNGGCGRPLSIRATEPRAAVRGRPPHSAGTPPGSGAARPPPAPRRATGIKPGPASGQP